MIRIGEFSSLAKTTIKTLRFYDEINLFKPSFVDDNGYRYYSIEQLSILHKIVELRNLGVSTLDIKSVLDGEDIVKIFERRLVDLENELKMNEKNISLMKKNILKARKGDFMSKYEVKEVVLPKCVVYYRKGIIEDMSGLTPFILEAGEEVRKNNPTLKCMDPEYCFVVYSNKEYKENDVEVEYNEAVVGFGKESKNIKFKELKEERAISVFHRGPYSKLGEAYAFAVNWVKEKGYEISNPIRERYIDGCWNKESDDEYLTEIQIPVK